MEHILFPGLNLEINISRVAFKVFGIEIYWYAIIIIFAIIMAILVCKKNDNIYGIKCSEIIDLAIYTVPISIICARIYYIIFNLENYANNTLEIFNFRSGGLAIYGGIIGGAICCYVYSKIKKVNFLDLLDYIALSIPLAQAIGRWGNFVNIEAYGEKTNLPWRMGIIEMGEYIEVHPTFIYESLATFTLFLFLNIYMKKRRFKGEITLLYLNIYAFFRGLIERIRTDSLMIENFRVSEVLSIIVFVISVVFLVKEYIKYNKKTKKEEKG